MNEPVQMNKWPQLNIQYFVAASMVTLGIDSANEIEEGNNRNNASLTSVRYRLFTWNSFDVPIITFHLIVN